MNFLTNLVKDWRGRKGYYADEEICRTIIPIMKKLRNVAKTYPPTISSLEEWKTILLHIQQGFESYLEIDKVLTNNSEEIMQPRYKILMNEVENSLELFSKFFNYLWSI